MPLSSTLCQLIFSRTTQQAKSKPLPPFKSLTDLELYAGKLPIAEGRKKMTEATPWLKAMENGGLGEARVKAFLMDRLWGLECSVDVEGADYLVQRRLRDQLSAVRA